MKGNKPSRKKVAIPVREPLRNYMRRYGRTTDLPLQYEDLLRYQDYVPLLNQEGEDTLWETVFYPESEKQELNEALTYIYALLKTDGDVEVMEHLSVARVDYCTFGNTKPFRVRIINRLNDNYDHFYVKRADASRVYGLELEELLSPNDVRFLLDRDTLIEEHIIGIPGDDFMRDHLDDTPFNQIRMAKEFVKFNERCFVRLLGDMRSYNFVVAVTPDIEGSQFRLRAVDFDQQSYEGWKSFYLPQYFKENNPLIFLGIGKMAPEAVIQYQQEERSLIANRIKSEWTRVNTLLKIMREDELSENYKVKRLGQELAGHHSNNIFLQADSMGQLVTTNLKLLLDKEFKHSQLESEF